MLNILKVKEYFVNYNNGLKEGACQTWDENGVSKYKSIL